MSSSCDDAGWQSSLNPDDGAVPSSVDDGVVPSVVADDGAAPSSFALWREERGVVAAFIFVDAARGLSSFACGREGDGSAVMSPTRRSS